MDVIDMLMVSGRIELEKLVELGNLESHDHNLNTPGDILERIAQQKERSSCTTAWRH